jgi:hypothetical protein
MITKKQNKKHGAIALSQIIILVIGIIAISYAIGSSIEEVSAWEVYIPPTVDAVEAGVEGVIEGMTWKGGGNIIEKVAGGLYKVIEAPAKAAKWAGEGLAKFLHIDKATWGQVATTAAWAAGIYFGVKHLLPLLGFKQGEADAAALAALAGYGAGKLASIWASTAFSIGAGIIIGFVVFLLAYKKQDTKTFTFTCDPYIAISKGDHCDKCNQQGIIPCTEYQCRSLGQACEIVNKGSVEEKCAWKSRNDIDPPIIAPWVEVLPTGFKYTPDNSINPPDRGVFIKYEDQECIPAFTPFKFGITANELVSCKIDVERGTTFDSMIDYMGGSSMLKHNHSQSMTLFSSEILSGQNITLENGGDFAIFVRCVDVNDNPKSDSPSASFVFRYCVDEGPDTAAPIIMGTNPVTNTAIAFNQSSIDMELYTNEPAECKWTYDSDKSFDVMAGTMQCTTNPFEMSAQMLYKCTTTLTGLQSRQENKFYFRCKDKPWQIEDRYEMQTGYEFILQGTEPLVIQDYGPIGKIKGSAEIVEVTLMAETAAGANEGEATCFYSDSCWDTDRSKTKFSQFFYPEGEPTYIHTQDNIWVTPGEYTCVIKCRDVGGNLDQVEFEYEVEVDTSIPKIVRFYQEGGKLKIITDEKGSCAYSFDDCYFYFADGLGMDSVDGFEHFTTWNTEKTYYIRCQDQYQNSLDYGECSRVIRPFDTYSGELENL